MCIIFFSSDRTRKFEVRNVHQRTIHVQFAIIFHVFELFKNQFEKIHDCSNYKSNFWEVIPKQQGVFELLVCSN